MAIEQSTDLDYLIEDLRLHIGDIDSTSYRYADEWLRTALVIALKKLQRWWRSRYTIEETNYTVSRTDNTLVVFDFDEPPVIQYQDESPIVLMASIIIKEGSLQNNSWNAGSWRDAEISYSNIQGSRDRDGSIERDWEELMYILKPPSKRLARTEKGSLPGYKENTYERSTKY